MEKLSHFEGSATDRASHPITHPSGNLPCSTVNEQGPKTRLRDPEEVQESKDETKS